MVKRKEPFCDIINEYNIIVNIKNISPSERYLKFKSYITSYKTLTDGTAVIRRIIQDMIANYNPVKEKGKQKEIPDVTLESQLYDLVAVHYPEFRLEVFSFCINADINDLKGQLIEYAMTYETVEKYLAEFLKLDISTLSITDEDAQRMAEEVRKSKPKSAPKKVKEKIDLSKVRKTLKGEMKGQDHVIDKILEKLTVMSAGLRSFTNLYFMGKSGVGKTLSAKLLAKSMFGDQDRLLQIDCAGFKHDHDDSKIFGSAPGYVGHGDDTIMSKAAKRSSAWVILFDEFEKAGEAFQDILLRLLDDGKIVGANGKELDFSNSIFIFTSNLGTDKVTKDKVGLIQHNYSKEELTDQFIVELKKKLKPEFVNRLRDIIVFDNLNEIAIREIIQDHLARLPIKVTSRLVTFILEQVNFHDFGARDVDKKIESMVEPILAREMLKVNEVERAKLSYIPKITKGKLSFVREDSKPKSS